MNSFETMSDSYLRDKYVPDVYQPTIYAIDYQKLKDAGIKLISFDIDDTIAGLWTDNPPTEAKTLFETLKTMEFEIWLLSNTYNDSRAVHFAKQLGLGDNYIARAEKPLIIYYKKLQDDSGLGADQIAHVGNSMVDDVAGGNTAGVTTCLVRRAGVVGAILTPDEPKLENELKKRRLWYKHHVYDYNDQYYQLGEIPKCITRRQSEVYEAVNEGAHMRSLNHAKGFIRSIEKIASKKGVEDKRISESKGNIERFSGYESIQTVVEFLSDVKPSPSGFSDVTSLLDSVKGYKSEYVSAYEQNNRLLTLEYENAVYILVTGLTLILSEHIDDKYADEGAIIANNKAKHKESNDSVILKTLKEYAKELKSPKHKEYLSSMVKIMSSPVESKETDDNINEAAVFSIVNEVFTLLDNIWMGVCRTVDFTKSTWDTVKKSFFGIVPLIRMCMYFKYKKKADTVLRLETLADSVSQNIDQLKNIKDKNMDEKTKKEIIKKQEATVKSLRNKAAKIRAELSETEKETTKAVKADNNEVGGNPGFSLD